ncbi:uncharacterized protein K452DRAFT_301580 [Aplosporella prunicola CBS 121167]|uniref:Uncharacterized protein n=1 Tax=Aplosporella prunicola CBS 121167 TaxID=1176127 RepID=A0A6A6B522_9PEZI|nr:uncharacterized protein K452DRAFT_301580 [Aplosporella prunicola CBS 121167]KAF2137851.1 hypothetical protein K452DRAFT_301580 [Aplosporella prunicola CBS 121167]
MKNSSSPLVDRVAKTVASRKIANQQARNRELRKRVDEMRLRDITKSARGNRQTDTTPAIMPPKKVVPPNEQPTYDAWAAYKAWSVDPKRGTPKEAITPPWRKFTEEGQQIFEMLQNFLDDTRAANYLKAEMAKMPKESPPSSRKLGFYHTCLATEERDRLEAEWQPVKRNRIPLEHYLKKIEEREKAMEAKKTTAVKRKEDGDVAQPQKKLKIDYTIVKKRKADDIVEQPQKVAKVGNIATASMISGSRPSLKFTHKDQSVPEHSTTTTKARTPARPIMKMREPSKAVKQPITSKSRPTAAATPCAAPNTTTSTPSTKDTASTEVKSASSRTTFTTPSSAPSSPTSTNKRKRAPTTTPPTDEARPVKSARILEMASPTSSTAAKETSPPIYKNNAKPAAENTAAAGPKSPVKKTSTAAEKTASPITATTNTTTNNTAAENTPAACSEPPMKKAFTPANSTSSPNKHSTNHAAEHIPAADHQLQVEKMTNTTETASTKTNTNNKAAEHTPAANAELPVKKLRLNSKNIGAFNRNRKQHGLAQTLAMMKGADGDAGSVGATLSKPINEKASASEPAAETHQEGDGEKPNAATEKAAEKIVRALKAAAEKTTAGVAANTTTVDHTGH